LPQCASPGVLGLGCATIGGLHGAVPEAKGLATLQAAWESGIRHFDVAPRYGAGHGENLVGRFLHDQPTARATVSTKVGWRVEDGRCVLDYSYDGVMRSFADSLRRLRMERVDAVFIHDVDRYNHGADFAERFHQAMHGALPALLQLRRDGRTGAVGVAVNDPAVCVASLDYGDPDIMLIAGRHTLLDHAADETLLPLCVQRGIRVMAGAPFNSGVLAVGSVASARFRHIPAPSSVLARVAALEQVCRRFDVSLPAAALQYPVRHPAITRVLVGARSASQIQSCARWMQQPISEHFWQALEDEALLTSVAGPIEERRA
jgi:D-threo-aldose 1-dehydrogenase